MGAPVEKPIKQPNKLISTKKINLINEKIDNKKNDLIQFGNSIIINVLDKNPFSNITEANLNSFIENSLKKIEENGLKKVNEKKAEMDKNIEENSNIIKQTNEEIRQIFSKIIDNQSENLSTEKLNKEKNKKINDRDFYKKRNKELPEEFEETKKNISENLVKELDIEFKKLVTKEDGKKRRKSKSIKKRRKSKSIKKRRKSKSTKKRRKRSRFLN